MSIKHQHWQAVPCGELPPGWEKVPAAAVYFHPATGRVLVTGSPDSEAPGGEGHSCDELGCPSVGAHNLLWASVTSPEDLQAMTTPDPIRELAEEIAEESAAHVYNKSLNDLTPEEYATFEACADHWEARLRSSLPTLASLLGELGVVRGALLDRDRLIEAFGREPDYCAFCDDEGCEGEPDEYERWRDEVLEPAEEAVASSRSALASDAGRLAGEVLRAVVEKRSGERNLDRMREGTVMDGPLPSEVMREVQRVADAGRKLDAAVDALLAACPRIREEVEGEPDAHGGPGEDERGRTWMGRPRGDGYL